MSYDKLLSCKICLITFSNWKLFQKHRKKYDHFEQKPFVCEHCSISFNYKINLEVHKAIHQTQNFFCLSCNKKFNRLASLKSHTLVHQVEETLVCKNCNEEFMYESDHLYHQITKHKPHIQIAPIIETNRETSINTNSDGAQIVKDVMTYILDTVIDNLKGREFDEPNDFEPCNNAKCNKGSVVSENTCVNCFKHFDEHDDMVRHIKVHSQKKRYECSHCGKSFPFKIFLTAHIKAQHLNPLNPRCSECDKSFSNNSSLKLHFRLHTGLKPFFCEVCDTNFRTSGNLRGHMISAHKNYDFSLPPSYYHQDGDSEPEESVHEVPLVQENESTCDDDSDVFEQYGEDEEVPAKIYISKERVKADQSADDQDSEATVEIIIASTSRLAPDTTKEIAEKNFDTVRRFICYSCRKTYKKISHLKDHMRIHTGEKPYQCPICCKSFSTNSILFNHSLVHVVPLNRKTFFCTECKTKFATKGSLNRHLKRIHNGQIKLHECSLCKISFKSDQYYQYHLYTTHRDTGVTGCSINTDNSSLFNNLQNPSSDKANIYNMKIERVRQWTNQNDKNNSNNHLLDAEEDEETVILDEPHMKAHFHMNHMNELTQGPAPNPFSNFVTFGNSGPFIESASPGTTTTSPTLTRSLTHPTKLPVTTNNIEKPFDDTSSTTTESLMTGNLLVDVREPYEPLDVYLIDTENNLLLSIPFASANYEAGDSFQNQLLNDSTVEFVPLLPCDLQIEGVDDRFIDAISLSEACGNTRPMIINLDGNTDEHIPSSDACVDTPMIINLDGNGNGEENIVESTTFNVDSGKLGHQQLSSRGNVNDQLYTLLNKGVNGGSCSSNTNSDFSLTIVEKTSDKVIPQPDKSTGKKRRRGLLSNLPHTCQYCSKMFRKPSDLKRHVRIHTGEKPYVCEKCSRGFAVKSSLTAHYQTHSIEKLFQCETCLTSLSSRSSLNIHMRLHTGQKPYKCYYCDTSFRTCGHRKSHIFTTHVKKSKNQNFQSLESTLNGVPPLITSYR